MMTGVRAVALFFLLALAAPIAAAPAGSDPAAAVDAFHSALRQGDPKAALGFLADDAIVFEDGRVERSKAEYALHHAAADAAFSRAVSSRRLSRKVHAGGTLALVASESRTKGRFQGTEVDRIMVETMVLRREAQGAWKIVHIHWSAAEPSTE